MGAHKDPDEAKDAAVKVPLVLSEGAGVALGTVFNRLVKAKEGVHGSKATGKRPRPERAPIVLAESDDVQKDLAEDRRERKKYKEAKRAKLKFENNALVVPDAATNATLEKELLATATKGAVALFNAVSKAQKISEEEPSGKAKKKGPPVSRESFMDMMRAGVSKETKPAEEDEALESESSDDDARRADKPGAKWLKNDFLTAGSKKLKDWDREALPGEETSSSDDESDENEESDSPEGEAE